MKAPDKIYVQRYSYGALVDGDSDKPKKMQMENIAYIRKDALLEWLEYEKEWFEGTDIEPHYQKVIDKLNKM